MQAHATVVSKPICAEESIPEHENPLENKVCSCVIFIGAPQVNFV